LFPPVASKPEPPPETSKGKRGRAAKAEVKVTPPPPASLLPQAATPEHLEAIRLGCLENGVDLELILEKWQVSRLEELDDESAQQVKEWLENQ
jgi:hypothetical protein